MATKTSSEAEEYERLRSLYTRIKKLREAVSANRIAYFTPLPASEQAQFFAASEARVRLVYGGNQSGKTTCGVVESIAHSLGYRPWLPEDHPDRVVRLPNGDPIPVPNVGRIVAESFESNIVQTIHPKIMEWAPRGEIVHIQRNQRGAPSRYDWKNGSSVHVLSYEQDDDAFEGTIGHWAWCDEPSPQRKFNGLRRGLIAMDGHMWMTMTPLAEPWINEVLASRANEPGSHVRLFNFDIWANCTDNGGTMSRKSIEEFLKDLPAAERQAREKGLPLHLAGIVFPEWQPKPPFWVPPFEIPRHWPRVCLIDPHPRKPICVMWAACTPDNQWVIYRALSDEKLTTIRDVVIAMRESEGWVLNGEKYDPYSGRKVPAWRISQGRMPEHIALTIIDTSANEMERTSGETVAEQFGAYGVYCVDAQKRNKDAGIKAIREALTLRAEWSQPGLIVFNTCSPVKQNFTNYVWDRWGSGKQSALKGDKQEAVKNNDDFIDLIRYIFQMRLTYAMLRSKAFRQETPEDEEPRQKTRNTSWSWRPARKR